jgi:hypothetical protein
VLSIEKEINVWREFEQACLIVVKKETASAGDRFI